MGCAVVLCVSDLVVQGGLDDSHDTTSNVEEDVGGGVWFRVTQVFGLDVAQDGLLPHDTPSSFCIVTKPGVGCLAFHRVKSKAMLCPELWRSECGTYWNPTEVSDVPRGEISLYP